MFYRFLTPALCLLALSATADAQADAQGDFDETAHLGTLDRYLNRGADEDQFLSRFVRNERCNYSVTMGQRIDDGGSRISVTTFDPADLATTSYEQRDYDLGDGNGISELVLPIRETSGPGVIRMTLSDPAGTQRQAYLDAFGGTCDGDTCRMEVPTPNVSFVVLGPDNIGAATFVSMALDALANACAETTQEGN